MPGRISFRLYNSFNEQAARDAGVCFCRNLFDNWPDAQCIAILRSLTPALKAGAHILLDDFRLQEPSTVIAYVKRVQRSVFVSPRCNPAVLPRRDLAVADILYGVHRFLDLRMMIYIGSGERTVEVWSKLLGAVRPNFEIQGPKAASGQVNVLCCG